MTSDSLYSHDFLYVSAESNPVILAKQSQNGARFNHSSDIAVLPWRWQHHRQVSWTLPSRYIHSEMTHSLSMRKYIWHWNILHIFYSDMKEKYRPLHSLQNKLSFSAQKKFCRIGDDQQRPVSRGQVDVRGWSRGSTQTLPDWWLDSGPSIRRHKEVSQTVLRTWNLSHKCENHRTGNIQWVQRLWVWQSFLDKGLSWGQIALFALLQPNTSLGVACVAAQFLPEVGGRNCSAKQGFAVAKRMRNWCFARKFLETTKGFHF